MADADRRPLLEFSRRGNKRRHRKLLGLCLVLAILLVVFITAFVYYYLKYKDSQTEPPAWLRIPSSRQQLQSFEFAAVAADATVCSNTGAFVLNVLGGNAMDAAVAAILCVGVTNFHSAGIGGGSFMLYYDSSTKKFSSFDYRETAPAGSTFDMFSNLPANASTNGGLAVAVPGEVAGLAAAHAKFGRLPWRTLVKPVSSLLRSGQRVSHSVASAMRGKWPELPDSPPYKELKDWMVNPATGRVYEEGDLLKDEKLAATFDVIAEDPASFYNGSLARTVANEIRAAGGNISLRDLREYRVSQPEPIGVQLPTAGLKLTGMPPPASGCVLQFILRLIDGFSPSPSAKSSLSSYVLFLHRLIESFKFGYAKRSALGDPEFVNVTELVRNLTSPEFADETRAKIDDWRTHDVDYYGPSFEWQPDSGTAHLSLIDSDGNAVAVTATINTYFGSKVRGSSTGIIYNDEMDDFSQPNRTNFFGLPPSVANFIAPGKRPMSSMTPAILTDSDGRVVHVTGGAGGSRIATAVAYSLARILYLNETVKEATDVFRLHHQLLPNAISVSSTDSPLPTEVRRELERKKHKFDVESYTSVVEAISRGAGGVGWLASGDFRKPSRPDGM